MMKYRAMSIIVGLMVFASVLATSENAQRTKRQAPNINVHQIPKTSFTCADKNVGDYYADPETGCQVYHICVPGMYNKMSIISFVCPNGTIFNQATKVCTPYERVDCTLATKYYNSINGQHGSARRNYEADEDYENHVPQPPPRQPQPPRQTAPPRNRNPPPPQPPREVVTQPPRPNRFRSGANQFRDQSSTSVSTAAPTRVPPAAPVRIPIPSAPVRPAFRAPIPSARGPQSPSLPNILPPRPTTRAVVSTSTSNYNYEYEYEYEDEAIAPEADQANTNTRNKREVESEVDSDSDSSENSPEVSENGPEAQGFTCDDKMPGGAYADVDSNCEMFHICVMMGKDKILDYKVNCASGTAFDQKTGSCRDQKEFTCEGYRPYEKPKQQKYTKKPIPGKKKYNKDMKKSFYNDKE